MTTLRTRCAKLAMAPAVRRHGPASSSPMDRAHWVVDLPRANAELLAEAGVPSEQIHGSTHCTGSNGSFFSDREARPCGRFGLLARLSP